MHTKENTSPQPSPRLRGKLLAQVALARVRAAEDQTEAGPVLLGSPMELRIVDETPEGAEDRHQLFKLRDAEGKERGFYEVVWGGVGREGSGKYWLAHVEVDADLAGKEREAGQRTPGIGKALYRHVATRTPPPDYIMAERVPYHLTASPADLNDASKGVWDSFVRDGEAERVEYINYKFVAPNGHTLAPDMVAPETL